jgi:hypothetical protein
MCLATRHAQAIVEYQGEIRKTWQKKKNGKRRHSPHVLTYENEDALIAGVIGSLGAKPPCLKKLTKTALVSFAYIFKAKMANDPFVEGHEIIEQLGFFMNFRAHFRLRIKNSNVIITLKVVIPARR